jgi:hypothetical protein
MVAQPYSELRARDLQGLFSTVDTLPPAPGSEEDAGAGDGDHRDLAAYGTGTSRFADGGEVANTSEAFKGRDIRVYVPRATLSAETSYVHDYPAHPAEPRCVTADQGPSSHLERRNIF